jgi:hypothetical protein
MSSLMARPCYLEKVAKVVGQACRRYTGDIDSNCPHNHFGVTKLYVLHLNNVEIYSNPKKNRMGMK